MRVNIDEIKVGGLDRSWDVSTDALGEILAGDRAGWRPRAGAHVEAHLQKLERRVLMTARARAALEAECSRCLAPVALELPVDFTLTFVPAEEVGPEGRAGPDREHHPSGGSFDVRRAEEEVYTGKQVDLDPVLREQLLLALPGYPTCREDCKGLCPACGGNLNERECGCDRRVPDPRWAGLAKVKL
jgi:uncharacterized protein